MLLMNIKNINKLNIRNFEGNWEQKDLLDITTDSWTLLNFIPIQNTGLCGDEQKDLNDLKETFRELGVKSFVVSTDSKEEQEKFVNGFSGKWETPIISDEKLNLARSLNQIPVGENKPYRSTVLISPDNKVFAELNLPKYIGRNFNEILRIIKASKAAFEGTPQFCSIKPTII